MTGHDWITPTDAAHLLHVTPTTLRVIAHRHNWRRIHIGRQTAYWLDDVITTRDQRNNPSSAKPQRPVT